MRFIKQQKTTTPGVMVGAVIVEWGRRAFVTFFFVFAEFDAVSTLMEIGRDEGLTFIEHVLGVVESR